MWSGAVLAFLKAVPELVSVVKSLGDTIKYVQDQQTGKEISKLKEQVNVYTKQIESATTNADRLRLVRELNRVVGL